MKAVILAGGLGQRLRPLTGKIPKPLLPIGDSTAIELAIGALASHGVREIFIASGYKAEQVEEHLGDGSRYGVTLHYSVEETPLGTCGPLSLLRDRLTEPFIMMNGDVVTDLDFEAAYRFAAETKAELTVVTKHDTLSYRYGVVRTDGDFVTGIEEKPTLSNEVLTGIYVVSPAVFDLIPEGSSFGIDELIDDLLARGRSVARYTTDAYWRDVGDHESYKIANKEHGSDAGEVAADGDDDGEWPAVDGFPALFAHRPDAERWLRSLPVIILALFALAVLDHALSRPVSYGETQTLMYAKQFAEPDFLPGDWYLNRVQPVRIPFQILIYPLIKLLPLPVVSLVGRMLAFLAVTAALGWLAFRLRINAAYAAIALGAFLWLDQALIPGEEWIFKRLESKIIAYALVLLALNFLAGKRWRWAGACAGLATTMHILVGGWCTVALALTVLSQRLGTWKERAEALGMWCVTGSAALYFVVRKLGEAPGPAGFDAASLWVNFRNPHYLLVSWWNLEPVPLLTALVFLVLLLAAGRMFPERKTEYGVTAHFALWTLAPFALGLAVSPFSFAPRILEYYPFRVADTLFPLLGLLIAVPVVFRYILPRQARPLVALVLVALFVWRGVDETAGALKDRIRFPRGGYWGSVNKTTELYGICDWVKENTPRGSLMIASPDINVVAYHCERPVAVTFRDVPSSAADLDEWYKRLVDFNGGREPTKQGYAAAGEINSTFNRLSEGQYRQLGKKYGGSYLLVYRRDNLKLPRVYTFRRWTVYRLGAAGDEGAAGATKVSDRGPSRNALPGRL
jgi:dTDP-glucose pyrophosphorylase